MNRPFDDQGQPRVRLESEAVLAVLDWVVDGEVELVGSEMIDQEIARMPDRDRRERVVILASLVASHVRLDAAVLARGRELQALGLRPADALHFASAEAAAVDAFLTTDDRLLKVLRRIQATSGVMVDNPLDWLTRETER